jgi:hypothetical protein
VHPATGAHAARCANRLGIADATLVGVVEVDVDLVVRSTPLR